MKSTNFIVKILACSVFFLALNESAFAYLDPVTGSLIIQGLIALIAGIIAGVKSVRMKIIGLFRRIFGRKGGK